MGAGRTSRTAISYHRSVRGQATTRDPGIILERVAVQEQDRSPVHLSPDKRLTVSGTRIWSTADRRRSLWPAIHFGLVDAEKRSPCCAESSRNGDDCIAQVGRV